MHHLAMSDSLCISTIGGGGGGGGCDRRRCGVSSCSRSGMNSGRVEEGGEADILRGDGVNGHGCCRAARIGGRIGWAHNTLIVPCVV